MHVHCARVAKVVEAPHLVKQLIARVDAVRRGGEVIEKLQLFGGVSIFLPSTMSS